MHPDRRWTELQVLPTGGWTDEDRTLHPDGRWTELQVLPTGGWTGEYRTLWRSVAVYIALRLAPLAAHTAVKGRSHSARSSLSVSSRLCISLEKGRTKSLKSSGSLVSHLFIALEKGKGKSSYCVIVVSCAHNYH